MSVTFCEYEMDKLIWGRSIAFFKEFFCIRSSIELLGIWEWKVLWLEQKVFLSWNIGSWSCNVGWSWCWFVDDWGSLVLNISNKTSLSSMVGHDLERWNLVWVLWTFGLALYYLNLKHIFMDLIYISNYLIFDKQEMQLTSCLMKCQTG